MQKLLEAIGGYGVQCSETKELSPPQYLLDAIDEQDKQLAAQQQQIAVYRDFVIEVRDEVLYQLAHYQDIPISLKELGITCEAFGQQTSDLLAQPFDTSALEVSLR